MSEQEYTLPEYVKQGFTCPLCGTLAQQKWYIVSDNDQYKEPLTPEDGYICFHAGLDEDIATSECFCCKKHAFWANKELVYPRDISAPKAHFDMPEEIVQFYNQARQISFDSPSAAAAFLRVVIAKICEFHDIKVRNLNDAIWDLSEKGLPRRVIQAMHSVRLLGNRGAHEGKIDLVGKDDREVVDTLFRFINIIVEKTISEPKEIDGIIDSLSKEKERQTGDRKEENDAK